MFYSVVVFGFCVPKVYRDCFALFQFYIHTHKHCCCIGIGRGGLVNFCAGSFQSICKKNMRLQKSNNKHHTKCEATRKSIADFPKKLQGQRKINAIVWNSAGAKPERLREYKKLSSALLMWGRVENYRIRHGFQWCSADNNFFLLHIFRGLCEMARVRYQKPNERKRGRGETENDAENVQGESTTKHKKAAKTYKKNDKREKYTQRK